MVADSWKEFVLFCSAFISFFHIFFIVYILWLVSFSSIFWYIFLWLRLQSVSQDEHIDRDPAIASTDSIFLENMNTEIEIDWHAFRQFSLMIIIVSLLKIMQVNKACNRRLSIQICRFRMSNWIPRSQGQESCFPYAPWKTIRVTSPESCGMIE